MSSICKTWLLIAIASVLVAGSFQTARADVGPTILKDSIRLSVQSRDWMVRGPKGDEDPSSPSWLPQLSFMLNGPIVGGSKVMADFGLPTKKNWLHIDFDTPEIAAGEVREFSCVAEAFPGKENVNVAGLMDFTISIRNELLETRSTLFSGKYKVVRVKDSDGNYNFYVDRDWMLPIGYVFLAPAEGGTRNVRILKATWTMRGYPGSLRSHLFFGGKEITDDETGQGADENFDPAKNTWSTFTAQFRGVYGAQVDDEAAESPRYVLTEHPGEYEIKILAAGHLSRSIKFSVDKNGLVDNDIATANKLGSDKIIVPVKLLGDSGPWNKMAWKTEALYGNPLTGFAPME